MKITRTLDTPIPLSSPATITIGNFDGVHLGHHAMLSHLKELAKKNHSPTVVITFENHPSSILKPEAPSPCLCTLKHRLKLLEEEGVDLVILLPFTKELSQLSAEAFLNYIRKNLPFSHLVLGHDATIGKERQGNQHTIQKIAAANDFKVTYLDQVSVEGMPISSSKIRALVHQGKFAEAENLLGRPYSIYSSVERGLGHGRKIGFPTANIDLQGICLPPFGVYVVRVELGGAWYDGVANLGYAPTVRHDHKPILEVHLFSHHDDLYGHDVEVVFCNYLRPEIKFATIEELTQQIAHDVAQAKAMLLPPRL